MVKRLSENPAGGPDQELQPVIDPVASSMAAAQKALPNPQPLYYQRGIPGRDGTGEWLVSERGAVMMPNGDYARPGDTFNQRDEGFNDAQMRHMAGKFIEPNKIREVQPQMVPKKVPEKVTKILGPKVVKSDATGGADTSSC